MPQNMFNFYNEENTHPGFSIDCVIISFYKGKLRILLNKPLYLKEHWSLPGGFMFNTENADQAAYRVLKERVGLKNVYLKQFYLFSDVNRTDIEHNKKIVTSSKLNIEDAQWYCRRFVSLGYYALVQYQNVTEPSDESIVSKWYDIDKLPPLYTDHENIIRMALATIRTMLPIIPIGRMLLPEKFAMTELRRIYEIILGKPLDRRNFQRKVLSEGWVVQLDEIKGNKTYNPTFLYKFNPDMDGKINFL